MSHDVNDTTAAPDEGKPDPALASPAPARGSCRGLRKAGTTLITTLVTLLGLMVVTFSVGRVLPTDPVLKIVGDRASQAQYDKVYKELGLDRPLPEQFISYVSDMARGDFGNSLVTSHPISEDILRFFPATFELATAAILIGVLVGLPLGALCARYNDRLVDHVGRIFSLIGYSMPIFWLGIVGLLVFYSKLGWVGGPGQLDITYQFTVPAITHLVLLDSAISGQWDAFANAISHIILPASLLGWFAIGYIARMVRSFLLWQMRQDYVTVLRVKGLSEGAIVWRHALRNATGPVLTIIALTYAYLLEGAVLTETVFAWPGLGMYITDSLFAADIPAVLVATLLVGIIFMIVNISTELIQDSLNPRSRTA